MLTYYKDLKILNTNVNYSLYRISYWDNNFNKNLLNILSDTIFNEYHSKSKTVNINNVYKLQGANIHCSRDSSDIG